MIVEPRCLLCNEELKKVNGKDVKYNYNDIKVMSVNYILQCVKCLNLHSFTCILSSLNSKGDEKNGSID